MNTRKQLLVEVAGVLRESRPNHSRASRHEYRISKSSLSFWRVIHDNLADIAALESCKLFSPDDGQQYQPMHWKNIATDPEAFRKHLLSTLGIYESKWRSYWAEMKQYRDHTVGHHNLRTKDGKIPSFDLGLEYAYIYYDYVTGELRKCGIEQTPRDLAQYGEAFAEQCRVIAEVATDATQAFQEKVH
jgi:hypothetical protein